MNKFIPLIILFAAISLKAQVTYNNFPKIGDAQIYKQLDHQLLDLNMVSDTGANKTWDFSLADVFTFGADTSFVIDPANAPHSNLFKNATYAIQEGYEEFATFDFFEVKNDRINLLGESDYSNDPPLKFNSGYLSLKLPLIYGTSEEDTANLSSSKQDAEFKEVHHVKGWGTMKTPTGSFPCIQVIKNSFYIISESGIPVINQTDVTYEWYSPQYRSPIAFYSSTESEDFFGNVSNDTVAFFLEKTVVGVNKVDFVNIGLSPNPVTDRLTITLDNPSKIGYNWMIINSEGKITQEGVMHSEQERINLVSKVKGAYLVYIYSKDKTWGIEKFVIQ